MSWGTDLSVVFHPQCLQRHSRTNLQSSTKPNRIVCTTASTYSNNNTHQREITMPKNAMENTEFTMKQDQSWNILLLFCISKYTLSGWDSPKHQDIWGSSITRLRLRRPGSNKSFMFIQSKLHTETISIRPLLIWYVTMLQLHHIKGVFVKYIATQRSEVRATYCAVAVTWAYAFCREHHQSPEGVLVVSPQRQDHPLLFAWSCETATTSTKANSKRKPWPQAHTTHRANDGGMTPVLHTTLLVRSQSTEDLPHQT